MRFGNSGELTHRYVYGPSDQVLADETFATVGSQRVSDEILWQLADQQGTIQGVVDDAGTLRKHVDYDSFGRVTGEQFYAQNGTSITSPHAEAIEQLFYYTGQERDAATDLQKHGARWYNPSTGRWLSEDPIGFEGGDANLYRAFGNSPTNFTDPTGTTQAGNPLSNLNLFAGGYTGGTVSPFKPVNQYVGSTSIFAGPTYNPYAAPLANLSSPIITQPAKPFFNTNLSGGVSSYSTPTTSRTDYLQGRIQEEMARGNLLEANYVRQQLAVETAGRTGAYPDQALYQSYNVQVQRNAGAIQNALEYPQRKVLGAIGTSPEELAAAAAYAGGDAYVPANRLVEVAPGIYRQPLVYAPEQNPNYSKYRVGTGILSDPLTYAPLAVGAAVNRGKAIKTLFSTGDDLLDAARATRSTAVRAYDVGTADALRARSVVGDAIDIHHVGQARPFEQLIPGYSRSTAPAIALPEELHRAIPPLRGTTDLTPRQVLARDIVNLRNYTDAPNSSLQRLIELNKQSYPGAFGK